MFNLFTINITLIYSVYFLKQIDSVYDSQPLLLLFHIVEVMTITTKETESLLQVTSCVVYRKKLAKLRSIMLNTYVCLVYFFPMRDTNIQIRKSVCKT